MANRPLVHWCLLSVNLNMVLILSCEVVGMRPILWFDVGVYAHVVVVGSLSQQCCDT